MTLQELENLAAILSAVGVGVAAITTFLNKHLVKPLKLFKNRIESDMTTNKETLLQHTEILKELKFNGGKSIKDVVTIINNKLDKTQQNLDNIIAMVKASFEFDTDGIFIADKYGNCYYFNKAYLDITGLSYNEALNFGWTTAIHPRDYEKILTYWKTCVEKLSNMELTHSYKNVKTKRVIKTKVSWQVQVQPSDTTETSVLIFGRVKPII